MNSTFDDLIIHIRRAIPQPRIIRNLQVHEGSGYISFAWKDKEFGVKLTLDVFEIRNRRIFITGASMLLSAELKKKENNEKRFTEAAESLFQAESAFRNPEYADSGFELLELVKKTLSDALCKSPPQTRSSERTEAPVVMA